MKRTVYFSIVGMLILTLSFSPAARAEIVVALAAAFSGQFEALGEQSKTGFQAAVDQINARGGLLGQPVRAVIQDDGCDPQKAVRVAGELAEMGVALVVGHTCSGSSIPASKIYAEHGIVQISPVSTAPQYTERGLTNVFRTCGRDDMQGFVIAEHIIRRHSTKKVGILYDASVYCSQLALEIKKALNKAGMTETFFMGLQEQEPTDFSLVLEEISKNKIGLVAFPSYPGTVTALLKQADKKGVSFKLIGADTLVSEDFVKSAGPLTDGVEYSFFPDPSHDRKNRQLVRKFKKKGLLTEGYTFYNYAAVQVWSEAVKKANTIDGPAVAQALRSQPFDTVLGKTSFNEKGDISQPGFVMYMYMDGQADYLQ